MVGSGPNSIILCSIERCRYEISEKGIGMSEQSNESQLLRGAFIPTLVVSLIAIATSAAVQGESGFWGALLAQFVVIIFFVIHIAVSRMTRNLDPISTMAMALFSYFAKLFALGILLWAIAKYTDRATINRIAFGVTAVALTIAWLWGEIASYMKLRLHLPLPVTKKPEEE
jgi:fructose-specific phosphotransferase system IIC component